MKEVDERLYLHWDELRLRIDRVDIHLSDG